MSPGRYVAVAEKWFIEDRETGVILCQIMPAQGKNPETVALNLAADLNAIANAREALSSRPRGGAEYWVDNLRTALYPTPGSGHVTPEGGQS